MVFLSDMSGSASQRVSGGLFGRVEARRLVKQLVDLYKFSNRRRFLTVSENLPRRLFLFFFEAGELVGDDFVFGEFGARGWTGGGAAVGGAEGFEDGTGVDAAAHGHAAGSGDLEDGIA